MRPARERTARAVDGVKARPVGRMGRVDQHQERDEPSRYRESSRGELELPRAKRTDTWPRRA